MPSQGMNILFILYHNDWSKMTENIENQQKMIDIKKCKIIAWLDVTRETLNVWS